MKDFSTFFRDEQRRSNVITSARIQTFCKKHNINIGCFDGLGICLRIITEKNITTFMCKNHFCLIWKSRGVSFKKAIEELKINFKVVDNVITDEHVKIFTRYEYKCEKLQSQLTDMIVY